MHGGIRIDFKKLSSISEIFVGARIDRFTNSEASLKNVIKKTFSQNNLKYELEKEAIDDTLNPKFLTKENDIIISLSDPSKVTLINEEGFIIPMQFAIIRLHKGIYPKYVVNILKSEIFKKELNKFSEGSALIIIKANSLKEIKIPIPDYEKQIIIGELLELIEKRIILKNKMIETDKKVKDAIINELIGGN